MTHTMEIDGVEVAFSEGETILGGGRTPPERNSNALLRPKA